MRNELTFLRDHFAANHVKSENDEHKGGKEVEWCIWIRFCPYCRSWLDHDREFLIIRSNYSLVGKIGKDEFFKVLHHIDKCFIIY